MSFSWQSSVPGACSPTCPVPSGYSADMDVQCDSEEVARAFGPYRLLPGKRLLLRGTEPMPIGSRALEILVTLVESAATTVGKHELIARACPAIARGGGPLRVPVA